ncbi:Semaphorin-2A [Harpegnathos saltator]|uniref:Semaphorin-2A n=1 Tax=Harpegnathos saltator TaxID=610380 RepID=E2C7X8_HARSA|nr:Semaphorin-2A [Harpegnathos saltator]
MLYYRTLYLDSKRDALYVGAMDKIFRLNLSNISHSSCEILRNKALIGKAEKGLGSRFFSDALDLINKALIEKMDMGLRRIF